MELRFSEMPALLGAAGEFTGKARSGAMAGTLLCGKALTPGSSVT